MKKRTGKIIKITYAPKNDREKLFVEILNGLEMKKDAKYPDSIFYCKGNEVYFEQDEKNMYFWCSYANVWVKFEDQFQMQYDEIQSFVRSKLWNTLELKGYTPLHTEMYTKMKNCPFCDSSNLTLISKQDYDAKRATDFVICLGCQAEGPTSSSIFADQPEKATAQAIERWNKRAN